MNSPPAIDWSSGAPRSVAFDDGYFARGDGLAESRAVFLQGLHLPHAWAGRDRFAVGELGFGTGLNVLALLQLWRDHRPSPDARLHVFSTEAHPLAPADARRALAAWPELADLAGPLLAAWPGGRAGPHRVAWPLLGAVLDLVVGDALEVVSAWAGEADGWMLDGFAPSRNPEMWSPALLTAVGARSRPGARAATFTVAGAVRRGLEAAGFAVAKRPGHGAKRERLEAWRPGPSGPDPPRRQVAVVGAGIAGAALARALRAEGLEVAVVSARPGASASPAALVAPRLDAGFGPAARLSAAAFARAVALYDETPGAAIARGALQLEAHGRDGARFDAVAAWERFDPGSLRRLTAEVAAERLGEASAPGALFEAGARVVDPAAVTAAWLAGARRVEGAAAHWSPSPGGGGRLEDAAGRTLVEADLLVLAGGAAGRALLPFAALRPVRGQLETAEGAAPALAAAWGGYAIPTRTGLLFGATHGRGDDDARPRAADRDANLAALSRTLPTLAAAVLDLPDGAVRSHAAVRLAAPDHLPLAGASAEGRDVLVLTALGGRGFSWAPLLAEHVAALAAGAPSPLPRDLAALVDPGRRAAAGTGPGALRSRSAPPPGDSA